jgi:hypothetical protein
MSQNSNAYNEVIKELNHNTNMYACCTPNNFSIIGVTIYKIEVTNYLIIVKGKRW